MLDSEPKVVRIEIEKDDGTILYAEGEHAQQIWDWWAACEGMNWIHGAVYSGKPLALK